MIEMHMRKIGKQWIKYENLTLYNSMIIVNMQVYSYEKGILPDLFCSIFLCEETVGSVVSLRVDHYITVVWSITDIYYGWYR